MDRAMLYRTIWRWHFYAGLFVIPFILLLSLSGSLFLFKPQIDAWEESAWRGPPTAQNSSAPAASADVQVAVAQAHLPGAAVRAYRLPRGAGEPVVVHMVLPRGGGARDIFVTPSGQMSAVVNPDQRWSNWIARLHGSLLVGLPGKLLVETAACCAIMLILSGLYLWWPRQRGLAGILWPRLRSGRGMFWRDLHGVTGFWVSALAMVLLLSGLPWTEGWATAFRFVRAEMGWVSAAPQDWKGGQARRTSSVDEHDHSAAAVPSPDRQPAQATVNFSTILWLARNEHLSFPVIIQPPHAPSTFGPPNGDHWKLTSETQNRPQIRTILFDAQTAAVVSRTGFADKHPIDRVINYGIAWHEGQLFGWINQLIGVLTGVALCTVAISGTMMWWRRRPQRAGMAGASGAGTSLLGAPPVLPQGRARALLCLLILPALLLPMLGLSLIVVAAVDGLVMLLRRQRA